MGYGAAVGAPSGGRPRSARPRRGGRAAFCAAAAALAVGVAVASPLAGAAAQAAAGSGGSAARRAQPPFPLVGRGDYWHSFAHPFEATPEEPLMHWEAKGGTILTSNPDTGRDVVRLTPALQGRAGIMYNTIHADSNDFSGYVDFEIKTVAASRESADGFAFWLLRDVPEVGPSMGISDKFVGLGVVVDTFANTRTSRTPYVYAYVNDGTVGWDAAADGKKVQLTQGCHVEINKPTRLYVSLLGGELRVAISTAHGFGHRYDCFSASGVRLGFTGHGIFAVSAETGHYFATHDVSAVQIMAGHPAPASGHEREDEERYEELHRGTERHFDEHGREVPRMYEEHEHHPGEDHRSPSHGGYEGSAHVDGEHHYSGASADHVGGGHEGHGEVYHADGGHPEGLDTSHNKLDAALEHKVSELRVALADLSSSTAGSSADKETISRLEALKGIILELLGEATAQASRFQAVSSALSRMARMATELRGTRTYFENELRQAEAAVETLHHTVDELRRSHGEVLSSLSAAHEGASAATRKAASLPSRLLRVAAFLLSQALVVVLAWVIAKSAPDLSTPGGSRRKT